MRSFISRRLALASIVYSGLRNAEEGRVFHHGSHGWARMKREGIGRKEAQKAQKGTHKIVEVHTFLLLLCIFAVVLLRGLSSSVHIRVIRGYSSTSVCFD